MNYHNLTYPDMNNGDGLRVVLWLSGCSHNCEGCQNKQTWDSNSGILFDVNAENELYEALSNDYISGVTFSGGDPLNLNNLEKVLNLIDKIRVLFPNKNIWLYSGYTWEELFAQNPEMELRQHIVSKCDVFIDGRYVENLRDITLHWCGSSNQRVIDVKQSFKTGEIVLWN